MKIKSDNTTNKQESKINILYVLSGDNLASDYFESTIIPKIMELAIPNSYSHIFSNLNDNNILSKIGDFNPDYIVFSGTLIWDLCYKSEKYKNIKKIVDKYEGSSSLLAIGAGSQYPSWNFEGLIRDQVNKNMFSLWNKFDGIITSDPLAYRTLKENGLYNVVNLPYISILYGHFFQGLRPNNDRKSQKTKIHLSKWTEIVSKKLVQGLHFSNWNNIVSLYKNIQRTASKYNWDNVNPDNYEGIGDILKNASSIITDRFAVAIAAASLKIPSYLIKYNTGDDAAEFAHIRLIDYNSPSISSYLKTYDINSIDPEKILNNYISAIRNKKSLLVKMPNGELGDKIVLLGLVNELKKKYKGKYDKIDVLIKSKRFNTKDGYAVLFRDAVDNCYTNEYEINEIYGRVMEISAFGIHNFELNLTANKEMQLSRYQIWGKQLGLVFRGTPNAQYFPRDEDIQNRKDFLDLLKMGKKIIGIAPITSNLSKDWGPKEKWQEVINFLHDSGFIVVILHYEHLNYKNAYQLENLNIKELGYVISKLHLLIGCESGLTHFAGILNIPMIVLLGPSSPMLLRHYNNVRILHYGNCHSCNRNLVPDINQSKCGSVVQNPQSKCLLGIQPEDVINEVKLFIKTIKKI